MVRWGYTSVASFRGIMEYSAPFFWSPLQFTPIGLSLATLTRWRPIALSSRWEQGVLHLGTLNLIPKKHRLIPGPPVAGSAAGRRQAAAYAIGTYAAVVRAPWLET